MDINTGAVFLTYKKPSKWNLLQRFFNWRIKRKGIKKYGKHCRYSETNHVRIYFGESSLLDKKFGIENGQWLFEYTFPTAKFTLLNSWMLDPNYCQVFNLVPLLRGMLDKQLLLDIMLADEGLLYDFLQLIDLELGWGRVLDIGKRNRVCSTGARFLLETALNWSYLFSNTKIYRTLPCAFANSSHFLKSTTDGKLIKKLLPEPEEYEELS